MADDKAVKFSKLVYVVSAIAATGGLLFGFDTGVISGALLFLKKEFALDSASQEFVVSAVLVGAIIGSAASGRVTDLFGGKRVIFCTAVIFALGTLIAALAPSMHVVIAGRVVLGIAIGIASYAVPLYISETSPARIRGALVSLNQLMITIGILVSYLVDGLFATTRYTWRGMFAVGLVPSIILGVGLMFLPASPRWLMARKRENDARDVLKRLIPAREIDAQMDEMRTSIASESVSGGWRDLGQRWIRPALFMGIAIMFFQQATGINTIIYYAPTIFQMAGFDSETAAIGATAAVGAVNVVMTIVSLFLIDRWGRRPLLLMGLLGMVASLVVVGLVFSFGESLGEGLKWAAVAGIFVYIAAFALSLGPIAWLLISEIYPLGIRGLAMSLSTVANWVFNFFIALTFLSLIETLGRPVTFFCFAAIGIVGWFYCYFKIPETKGCSLESIEADMRARKPSRRWGR
ncbi:MAG: sugar porter family MFS transporter [Syntrophaceae bacterium]